MGNDDKWTNNGLPPGTRGGCGGPDHFRNDCPQNPNKGKGKQGVGGVDDEEWPAEDAADKQTDDHQQADEGGSVWDEDEADCGWAVDDDVDDEVNALTDAQ